MDYEFMCGVRSVVRLSVRRLQAVIGVCLIGLCTAACPLPVAHTEVLAAPVVGTLRQDDGTAIAGARVAVSTELGDSACMQPAHETTTDSLGEFRLPAIEKRYSVTWVIPGFDSGKTELP